jgi:hypothetical protein
MPSPENNNPLTLRDSKASDIKTASIQNKYGTFNIAAEDGGYTSDDIPPAILDIQEFYDLMTYCAAVNVKQVVDEAPGDLSLYGLDKPEASVDVVYSDDSELKFYIGNQERITGNYYCSVEGKSAVYLMEAQRCSAFHGRYGNNISKIHYDAHYFTDPWRLSVYQRTYNTRHHAVHLARYTRTA